MERTGIDIKYWTNRGQYTPPHWHGAIELLYILNGEGAVTCDGKEYLVQAGQFIVIDSDKIHEMKCAKVSMMLIIHFSRKRMENY
ncbi:cupin domain-containing protein, partial [Anaerostipes sp.]